VVSNVCCLLTVGSKQLQVVRDLGESLADVAAFMHEVDIRQGFWTQRTDNGEIERMRQVALKLQNLSLYTEPDVVSDYPYTI
jgi:hypothetical protein